MFIFESMKEGKNQYYILLLILIATVGIYASVSQLDFVNWDDDNNVRLNTHIQEFSCDNLIYNFEHERYKSLALYSFMIDYQLWKLKPSPYHIHNLILHLINIILVFLVVNSLSKNKLISLVVAGLFALHPVSVEAVAWITGRKDLLFMLFSMLSILAYVQYQKKNYNLWWLLIISLFVFLASMAKIQAFVLPVVFIALDIYYKRKFSVNLVLEKLMFFLIVAQTNISSLGLFAVIYGLLLITIFVVNKYKSKIILPKKVYGVILYYIAICVCGKYIGISNNELIIYSLTGSLVLFILIKKNILKHFGFDKLFSNKNLYWLVSLTVFFISLGVFFITITDNWWKFNLYFWSDSGADVFSFPERLLLAGNAFMFYIKRLFLLLPFNPMPAYPEPGLRWSFGNIYFVNFLISILILFVLAFVIIKNFKKNRLLVFGILVFLINISIVMHIIPIEGRVVAADRYAYPSFWGLFIVMGYLIDKLRVKYNYLKVSAVSLICVCLAINSYSTISVWKNSYTLWQKAVTENNKNSYAFNSLGIAYLELKQDPDSALILINNALSLKSDVSEYHVDKGRVLFKLDSLDSALICFNNAILMDSANDMAFNNRGTLYVKTLQYQKAVSDFQNALKINNELELYKENYSKAMYFLKLDSVLLSDFSSPEYSIEEKTNYVKLVSDKLIAQNKEQTALEYLLTGLKLVENDIDMLQNVAAICSKLGQYNNSIEYYKQLINLNPDNAEYYYYLANNYYNNGNKVSACENWSIAIPYGHNQAKIYFDTYCK